jgi:glycosyltransferase involved in cell wall biosynthesis
MAVSAQGNEETIAVVGPVLPFRGGIAQHTTMLSRALAQQAECHVFSFKRLYPQWLFPGESDRDPDYAGHREPGTQYGLDSLNPLTWRTAVQQIRQLQPAFVLIPWWTFFLGPMLAYIAWSLRRSRIPVVFFCHNVLDHEQAAWKRALTRLVLRQGSRFVVHTQVEAERLAELIPNPKVTVHPHPIYDQFPPSKNALPRRAGLELLFYGFVRPYKGLDLLVEAMGELKGKDVFLTVAGEFWEGQQAIERRIRELGIESQIEIRARYHSDEETADLFTRADVVVLPYRSATGSGVVPIAYHYDRPVIVTRVGGLPEVVTDHKTGRIIDKNNQAALVSAIQRTTFHSCAAMHPAIQQIKTKMSWQSIASKVLVDN